MWCTINWYAGRPNWGKAASLKKLRTLPEQLLQSIRECSSSSDLFLYPSQVFPAAVQITTVGWRWSSSSYSSGTCQKVRHLPKYSHRIPNQPPSEVPGSPLHWVKKICVPFPRARSTFQGVFSKLPSQATRLLEWTLKKLLSHWHTKAWGTEGNKWATQKFLHPQLPSYPDPWHWFCQSVMSLLQKSEAKRCHIIRVNFYASFTHRCFSPLYYQYWPCWDQLLALFCLV